MLPGLLTQISYQDTKFPTDGRNAKGAVHGAACTSGFTPSVASLGLLPSARRYLHNTARPERYDMI